MPDRVRLGIVGSTGRLGRAVRQLANERGIDTVLEGSRSGWVGHVHPTAIVDVSHPAALSAVAQECRATGAALIECVSDLGDPEANLLRSLSRDVPVVVAPNLSVGHWLQARMVDLAAGLYAVLPDQPHTAISERHPVGKRDAPSATATALGNRWQAGTGCPVDEVVSMRTGLPVSEHAVQLTFGWETLTLHHDVRDLRAAAAGALIAATRVSGVAPGLIPMQEIYDQAFVRSDR